MAAPTAFAGPQGDDGCLISPKVAIRRAEGGARIVDVRKPADFRTYRIPDSLNIPLYAVKANPFLKAEQIILIDSGPQLRELLPACKRLKAAGFARVHVLRGGISAWQHSGGKLDGMPPANGIGWLKPRDVLLEYDPRRWRIFRVTSAHEGEETGRLPYTDTLYFEELRKRVRTEQWQKERRFIAIVADEPADYQKLTKVLGKERGRLYFIAGGTRAYLKERHRLQSISDKRVFVLQKPSSCSR